MDLMHGSHAEELQEWIEANAGLEDEEFTIQQADYAIQAAMESIKDEDGIMPNIDREDYWDDIRYRAALRLGYDQTDWY